MQEKLKCAECGKEAEAGAEGWVKCEDCGTVLCPTCATAGKGDSLEAKLRACPTCGGKLSRLDWS